MADIVAERLRHTAAIANGFGDPDGFAWSQAYRQDVTSLLARLSAAEQERDKEHARAHEWVLACAAAEARTEAAEGLLRDLGKWSEQHFHEGDAGYQVAILVRAHFAALAALAGREPPNEPDPATISVTQGGIGDTHGFFLPPGREEQGGG